MIHVIQIPPQIEQGDPSATEQFPPLVYDDILEPAAAKVSQEHRGADGFKPRPLFARRKCAWSMPRGPTIGTLGRRCKHRRSTGSVFEDTWIPVGLTVWRMEITESRGPEGEAKTILAGRFAD